MGACSLPISPRCAWRMLGRSAASPASSFALSAVVVKDRAAVFAVVSRAAAESADRSGRISDVREAIVAGGCVLSGEVVVLGRWSVSSCLLDYLLSNECASHIA